MSRIRSIHPGLWTDEAFVSLSPMARLFFIGIWNECDDMGSFEWSPLKLKMRLLPADGVDGAALLAEIADAGNVMRYEIGGKAYGAVRNFCQYQRPKKPNSTYPQSDEVRAFVGTEARLTRDGGEAVGKELPTGGEKSRQMEEGGGRRSSDADASAAGAALSAADLTKIAFDAGLAILTASDIPKDQARSLIGKWRKRVGDAEMIMILRQAQSDQPSQPVEWISAAVERRANDRSAQRGENHRNSPSGGKADGFTAALREARGRFDDLAPDDPGGSASLARLG